MSEKGISLAINQIVILIVGLVIFGLGLTLMFQVFGTAKAQLPGVDSQLEQQLISTLSRGDVVEMPLNNRKGRGDELLIYNFGVKNDPRITQGIANFTLVTSYNTGINRIGNEFCTSASAPDNKECKAHMNSQALLLSPDWVTKAGATEDDTFYYKKVLSNVSENDVIVDNIGIITKNNDHYQGIGQYFYNLCVCIGNECEKNPGASIEACNATEWAQVDNPYKFLTYSATIS